VERSSATYEGFRGAGVRLRERLLPELGRLAGERTRPFLYALHAFDKAHAVMLVEEGLLPAEVGAELLQGLRSMEQEGVEEVRMRHGGALHSGEQFLIRTLGEDVGGRLHLGRSSGDLSSVGINIAQRDRLLVLTAAVNELRRVLLELAETHTGTVLPGYTFGQVAQPMTFAHLLLSWASTLERDFDRLHGCYRRVNVSAAGCVIMVGTDFPLNRERTAELLGFDRVHENAADAILELTTDDMTDAASAVAVLYHSLAKWADDLILWSTREVDFVVVPDRFCSTSSVMPQKRNVVGLAEVKGGAAEALGCVVTTFDALRGPTGLAINERHYALELLWRVCDSCLRDLGWLSELLPALQVRAERMHEVAAQEWASATDLAGALVRARDLPWRTAHQVVAVLIRLCEERGLGPNDVTPELLDEAARRYGREGVQLEIEAIQAALDPVRFVQARTLRGGPAATESQRQRELLHVQLLRDEETLGSAVERVASSAARLEQAIDAILASAA
jgi:argininosuccinate lyase